MMRVLVLVLAIAFAVAAPTNACGYGCTTCNTADYFAKVVGVSTAIPTCTAAASGYKLDPPVLTDSTFVPGTQAIPSAVTAFAHDPEHVVSTPVTITAHSFSADTFRMTFVIDGRYIVGMMAFQFSATTSDSCKWSYANQQSYWTIGDIDTAAGTRTVSVAIPWTLMTSSCNVAGPVDNNGYRVYNGEVRLTLIEALYALRGSYNVRAMCAVLPWDLKFQNEVSATTNINVLAPAKLLGALVLQCTATTTANDANTVTTTVMLFSSLQSPFYATLASTTVAKTRSDLTVSAVSEVTSLAVCAQTANAVCEQYWKFVITPVNTCTTTDTYTVSYTVNCKSFYTAAGNTCPLDSATNSASVSVIVTSEDFCPITVDTITASANLKAYKTQQSYSTGASGQEKYDFILGNAQTMYFLTTVSVDASKATITQLRYRLIKLTGVAGTFADSLATEVVLCSRAAASDAACTLATAGSVSNMVVYDSPASLAAAYTRYATFQFQPVASVFSVPEDASRTYTVYAKMIVDYTGNGYQTASFTPASKLSGLRQLLDDTPSWCPAKPATSSRLSATTEARQTVLGVKASASMTAPKTASAFSRVSIFVALAALLLVFLL